MDTIESIKAALNEWIAEDPSRKFLQVNGPELNRILKRADELIVQRRRLQLERCYLEDHLAMVDQEEWILSDWETALAHAFKADVQALGASSCGLLRVGRG